MGSDPVVEATAGAVGTLVTCILLYPVEIAKLHMQAGKSKASALQTIRRIAAAGWPAADAGGRSRASIS